MKKHKKKFEGITVWVENRIAGETFIPAEILGDLFQIWLRTKEKSWLEYYWLEAAIRGFMTDKAPGCNGVFEEKDFDGLYEFLKPIAEKHMEQQEQVN